MTRSPDLEFPRSDWVRQLVDRSLAEDIGSGDATTAVGVPAGCRVRGTIVARRPGVVAGLPLVESVFSTLSDDIQVHVFVGDGEPLEAGTTVAEVVGPGAPVLTGERTALNFLQHLSGIASLTARYVAAVEGTQCRILDTRKTLPGYRALEKYAVRAGGGTNHRLGLYDRIMFKDNHWAASGVSVAELVARARKRFPDLAIEVEVDSVEQMLRVLPLGIEWILLDNFSPAEVVEAVRLRDRHPQGRAVLLEGSGNISLETVRQYAETGLDAVSCGRLTHSAPALDLSLELEWSTGPRECDAS